METWVTKTFGGDRMILMPTRLQANSTAPLAALPHIGQEAATKLCAWHIGGFRPEVGSRGGMLGS
jgi:hypothetical protein